MIDLVNGMSLDISTYGYYRVFGIDCWIMMSIPFSTEPLSVSIHDKVLDVDW